MESLHFVEYSGKNIETTVTNKASVAKNWLLNMKKSLEQTVGLENRVIGIGCKFLPPLNPTFDPDKIATLQLCMDTKCLVLQLHHMDHVPERCFIRNLLANSCVVTFVGVEVQKIWHSVMSDYKIDYSRRECKLIDVHLLAKAWFPMSYRGRPSLKVLARGVAGLPMRKSAAANRHRYGDGWGSKFLDEELVQQACVDAYAAYEIGHTLLRDA